MHDLINVQGAYGRSYKGSEDARKDWNENKDFHILFGSPASYLNKSDVEKYSPDAVINCKTETGYHRLNLEDA